MVAAKVHLWAPDGEASAPLVLESLGRNPEQEPVDRPRGHRAFHWLATTSGRGSVEWGCRSVALEPGQGVLLAPSWPHRYRSLGDWSTEYLTFWGPLAFSVVSSLSLPLGLPLTWSLDSPLSGHVNQLVERHRVSDATPGSRSADVYRFLTLLNDHARLVETFNEGTQVHQRLVPLWRFIDDHLSDPALSVEDLARVVQVTPRHLSGLFARAGHVAPYQYLRQRRIARARELLVGHREWGVKEVSYHVGFRDPSHFIAAFRQLVGKTPEQFRQGTSLTASRR